MTKEKKESVCTGGLTVDERKACDDRFREIIDEMRKRFVPDVALLNRAYGFAAKAHKGQRRAGGQPYLTHPLEVAMILAKVGFESDLVASALLHDVIEDCGVTVQELEQKFGSMIAQTVDAVSQVNANLAKDPEIQKADLDALSDIKFLTATTQRHNRKAFYIKLADRIHNLRTISAFPEEKQRAKVLHTRNVLLPAAKVLHIYKLVDILESLCLKIENPEAYRAITEGYERILVENAYTLDGENGIQEFFRELISDKDPVVGQYVVSLEFGRRYSDSIYRNLVPLMRDIHELEFFISKEYIPLYNINFTVNDQTPGTPESVFFRFYQELHESRFGVTIVGTGQTMGSGALYYKLKDRFGNSYRLFIQTESELLHYSHGVTVSGRLDDIRGHLPYLNQAEPDEPEHKMIPVYLRNGKMTEIEEGATVLDLAFQIHSEIGICAKYAHMNNGTAKMPIHTRLRPGDVVNIIAKPDETPDACIRWFEYLHTREAVKALSRWLETHADVSAPTIAVFGPAKDRRYDLPMGATVLDFVLLTAGDRLSEGFQAFLNKSAVTADLARTLRYNDQVRIRFGGESANTPELPWFGIVKTPAARDVLLKYFEGMKTAASPG